MECEYCHQELPYKQRKSHECDAYYEYKDAQEAEQRLEEEVKHTARKVILADHFTDYQAEAIINLIDHIMIEEER